MRSVVSERLVMDQLPHPEMGKASVVWWADHRLGGTNMAEWGPSQDRGAIAAAVRSILCGPRPPRTLLLRALGPLPRSGRSSLFCSAST